MAFCRNCGKELPPQATFCPSCGTSVEPKRRGKSKTAAVLLAIFLVFWTWLYTYKRDAWKFWVGLGINLIASGIGTAYIVNFIAEAASTPMTEAQALEMIFGWVIWITVFSIISFGTWVWAIVDTAVKNQEWYDSYDGPATPGAPVSGKV